MFNGRSEDSCKAQIFAANPHSRGHSPNDSFGFGELLQWQNRHILSVSVAGGLPRKICESICLEMYRNLQNQH